MERSEDWLPLGRRAFLQGGTLMLAASAMSGPAAVATAADEQPVLRVGLVTDLHYADRPPAGSRYYRKTLTKLAEAAEQFQESRPDVLVELGDFIDAAETVDEELGFLARVNRDFARTCDDRHYVLGNHCVFTLTKDEFLKEVGQEKAYYSFDRAGFHFVVLDSCFRSDGTPYGRKNFKWTDANIPPAELEWLANDLAQASKPTVVFAHQRLDVSNNYGVKNAAAVREVLANSGHVLAVFQGHSHKNDHKEIGGIHYCTLVAMVEGDTEEDNGYSVLSIYPSKRLELAGFRRQQSHDWPQQG